MAFLPRSQVDIRPIRDIGPLMNVPQPFQILKMDKRRGNIVVSRRAILEAVARSRYLRVVAPAGAMYAFVEVRRDLLPDFDDQRFAMDLLEQKHVLIAPGVSFNVPYRNHFRITNLPDAQVLRSVFQRIEEVLDAYAAGATARTQPDLKVITPAQR